MTGHSAVTSTLYDSNLAQHQESDAPLDTERKEVLDWLFEIASVNHGGIQSATYAKLAPDTASWILREPKFYSWLSQGTSTFWGVGKPGAGKTALTSYVINHLQERAITYGVANENIIFAYCRFNESLNILKICAALLRQLCERFNLVLSYTQDKLYKPFKAKRTTPTEREIVTHIRSVLGLIPSKTFIVIDALDELQDDVRDELLQILLSLQRPTFLTSRELSLAGLHTPDIHLHSPVESFKNFIIYQVRCLTTLCSLLEDRQEVLEELVQIITSKSDRLFLLATLELSALGGTTTITGLRKAMNTLPGGDLKDIYKLTLDQVMDQGEKDRILACRALLWVTHAYQPLKISELLEALAVEPDATELDPDARTGQKTLIIVCCGLLTIEDQTGTIRLIHDTAYEFFLSYRQGLFCNPHSYMATICVVYWHLSGIDQLLGLPIWMGIVINYRRLKEATGNYPFIEYACRHMGYHTYRSSIEGDCQVPQRVDEFLSENQRIPLSHVNLPTGPIYQIPYGKLIHFAALHGLSSSIKLSAQAFKEKSSEGNIPLLYAVIGGHAPTMELLLALPGLGIFVNYRKDDNFESSLHIASKNGDYPIVQLLLKSPGIDVNVHSMGDCTPLHLASKNGHESVVKLLLEYPYTFISEGDREGKTALHHASENGHDRVVRLLLYSSRTPVNAKDRDGYTALHYAAKNGHEKAVRRLLDFPGIDVKIQIRSGQTAHELASQNNHEAIVQVLTNASSAN